MDDPRREAERRLDEARRRTGRRRPRKPGGPLDPDGVPVEPNRPNDLTGGAAAAIQFDDEA